MTLPPISEEKYNREKHGFYGELGQGANAIIRFLQTGLSMEELDSITLIENIPGSETWDVRDLFQRDVDQDRVTRAILPYLKDRTKVKFFNPLTLMLLPLDDTREGVEKALVYSEDVDREVDGHRYSVFERDKCFQFKVHHADPAFSTLEWHDQRVKVVAIDGQHRLSALKRWKNEPGNVAKDLRSWTIPVVILGVFKANENVSAANLLEICRKTFVYINSRAETVNDARRILLDDESINALCTQELIQAAHSNDIKPLSERDEKQLPLLFFDWRGEVHWKDDTKGGVRVTGPAAVKTIEEVHAWFREYLLGDDGSEWQQEVLALDDMVPPLQGIEPGMKLSHDEALQIRQRFRETLYPGLSYMLTNFTPYKEYIRQGREIERATQGSDVAGHAFSWLRFGSCQASQDIFALVQTEYDELERQFSGLKGRMPELISLEIGMRAIIFAFASCRELYLEELKKGCSWSDYAKWFIPALNRVFDQGWFASYDDLSKDKRNSLLHIAFDASGSIQNYRYSDVEDGLGSLVLLLICKEGKLSKDTIAGAWEEYGERLRKPLVRGFRKFYKGQLHDFTGTPSALKAEVTRRAESATKRRLNELRELVGAS